MKSALLGEQFLFLKDKIDHSDYRNHFYIISIKELKNYTIWNKDIVYQNVKTLQKSGFTIDWRGTL